MEIRKRLSKQFKACVLAGMIFSFAAMLSIPIGAILISNMLYAPLPAMALFALALCCGAMAANASKKLRLYTPPNHPFSWD